MGARVGLRAEVDPEAGVTPTAGLGAGPTPTLPTLGAGVGDTATAGPGAGADHTLTPLTRQDPDHEPGPDLPPSRDAAGHRASSTKGGSQGERQEYRVFFLTISVPTF